MKLIEHLLSTYFTEAVIFDFLCSHTEFFYLGMYQQCVIFYWLLEFYSLFLAGFYLYYFGIDIINKVIVNHAFLFKLLFS